MIVRCASVMLPLGTISQARWIIRRRAVTNGDYLPLDGWQLKWTLFPTAKSPYAIQKKYTEDPVSGPYTPWVVGCIAYQSTADKNDPVHTTPFAAYLSVEDAANVIDDAAPNPIDPNAVGPPLSKSLVGKSVGATGGD